MLNDLLKRLFGKKEAEKSREYVVHFWKDMKCESYGNAVECKVKSDDIERFCYNVQTFLNARDNVKGILGWHFWVDDKVPDFVWTEDKNGIAYLIPRGFKNFKDIVPENDDAYNLMVSECEKSALLR